MQEKCIDLLSRMWYLKLGMINLIWVKERLIIFLLILLIFLPPTFLLGGYPFSSLILIESLILFAGLIWSLGRIKLIKSSLTLPILFYIIACLLSIINSHYLRGSWEEITKLACGIILFLMVGNYFTVETSLNKASLCRLKLLVHTFILTTLIVISFSLTQFFMHLPESLTTRLYYPLGNPNILGGFLTITIPLIIRILFVSPVKFRFLSGILLLFSFMTLYLSYSKGAGLGTVIAILFLFSINLPGCRKLRGLSQTSLGTRIKIPWVPQIERAFPNKFGHPYQNKIPILILCLSIAIGLFIIYISAGIWEHSLSQRVYIWKHAWQMFLDHPILGTGLGTYSNVYFDYKGNTPWHLHSHNIFLQYACEMGIIGVLSFAWLITTLFKISFKNTGNNYEKAVREGLLAGMVGFLVQAQVDYLFWIPVFQLYFWLILGVLSCRKTEGEYVSNFSRPIPLIIILFWVFCVLMPWVGYTSFKQGVALADKGKWQEAKEKFESAVLLDFYHPIYHAHLGTSYTRIQPSDLSSAIKEYETAIEVDNYNRSSYYNLSLLYYQKGDFLKAQKALSRAIKLDRVSCPRPPWIYKREEFIHKANSFYARMVKLNDEKKKNTLSWILYRREPMLKLKVGK